MAGLAVPLPRGALTSRVAAADDHRFTLEPAGSSQAVRTLTVARRPYQRDSTATCAAVTRSQLRAPDRRSTMSTASSSRAVWGMYGQPRPLARGISIDLINRRGA